MNAVTPHRCPGCGCVNEFADAADPSATPSAGAWSLCWKCGYVAVFEADGSVRPPTGEERAEMAASAELREARHAIAESHYPSEAIALIRASNQ